MIRPTIVFYTENWRPGVARLAQEVGWTEEVADWTWNPETTLLAIWQGHVVGFVAGWLGGQPVAIIEALVVTPYLRERGIGVALWRSMTDHLISLGAKRIRFLVTNPRLKDMLSREGFGVVGDGTIMEGVR